MVASYNIQPGETGTERALRRRLAMASLQEATGTQPIQHWMQGAANVAKAVMAGLELRKLDQEGKAEAAADRDLLLSHPALGGQTQQPAASAAPRTGMSRIVELLMPKRTKIYENDEPSPLDPPSGNDRDLAIRTVLAEAGNQGPVGQQAVASVIRNRAAQGIGGDNPSAVVTSPNQFEPFNTPQGRARLASYDPNSPQYQQASAALDRAYTGDDPTRGAVNFYAPKAQAQLAQRDGRPVVPPWAIGREGQDIGDHRFYRPRGVGSGIVNALMAQPDPVHSAGTTPASLPDRPAQGVTGAGDALSPMTQGRQVSAGMVPNSGRQVSVASASTIPAEYQTYIRQLIANPRTRAQGVQLLNQFSAPKDDKPSYGVIGQDQYGQPQYGWIDPRTRSTTPAVGGAQPQAQPVIPPPPPGVDPKAWREAQTKNYIEGQLPPKGDDVSGLRKEVRGLQSVKNLNEVLPRVEGMRAAATRDNRASDLTLIYGLMKTLDPTSVVRETEADMAANIATVPEKFRQQVESFLQGKGRLAPQVREAMLVEAVGAAGAYYDQYERDITQYRGIAQRRRMDEADVIPTFNRPAPFSRAGEVSAADRATGAAALKRKYGLE